jgi:2-keto-4-pentenoate hydratase/2-oxohepta-3-ene-1,7-dioic acid hydratase in catechol pathway
VVIADNVAGTTVPAGSLIMTGSPPGIGFFSEPKYNLKDGDVVEIEISALGKLSNRMIFER